MRNGRWRWVDRRCCTIVAFLLCGCGGERSAGAWGGTVEALPGGGQRVVNPERGIWETTGVAAWRLEEELRIGAVDGDGPDVFGRIGGLFIDPNDRIHVVEAQLQEIRVFAADGEPVRVMGREGEGPGEFRHIGGLAWDESGTTWVQDAMNARYTRFDSGGSLLETRPRQSRAVIMGGFLGGITPSGVVYDLDVAGGGDAAVPPLMAAAGLGSSGRMILRSMFSTADSAVADTVHLPEDTIERVVFTTERAMLGAPFNPRLYWVFDPLGFVWFGTSDAYRIVKRSFEGDTTLLIERAHTPLPVGDADIDEWLESPGPVRFRASGGVIDRGRIPNVKPVFDWLLIDDRSHLWVRRITNEDTSRFDVFDSNGRYLGAVEGRRSLRWPVVRGNRFYAVITDSLDVPYVVRYRLIGRDQI